MGIVEAILTVLMLSHFMYALLAAAYANLRSIVSAFDILVGILILSR